MSDAHSGDLSYDHTEMNPEGMTWSEWAYAVGVRPGFGNFTVPELYRHRYGWAAGEDPTDWRAEREGVIREG